MTGVSAEAGGTATETVYDITMSDGNGHTKTIKVSAGTSCWIKSPVTYDGTRQAAVITIPGNTSNGYILQMPADFAIPSSEYSNYIGKEIYLQTSISPSGNSWIQMYYNSMGHSGGGHDHGSPTDANYYHALGYWPNSTEASGTWYIQFTNSNSGALTLYLKKFVFVKAPAFATRGDGAGTSASPYLIKDFQDLQDLSIATSEYNKYYSNSTYIKLNNDIDGEGAHINPIGYSNTLYGVNWSYGWKGHFNGNGKTISNIVVDHVEGDTECGLFNRSSGESSNKAEIKNLTLQNCTINGGNANYVGGIVGYAYYDCTLSGNMVRNCTVNKNTSLKAGVIAGEKNSPTLSNNKYTGDCRVIANGTTYTYGTGTNGNGLNGIPARAGCSPAHMDIFNETGIDVFKTVPDAVFRGFERNPDFLQVGCAT